MTYIKHRISKQKNTNLRRLKKFINIFIAIYFLIGIAAFKSGVGEIFPIFSWSLFSTTPTMRKTSFDILIHGTTKRPIHPPVPFNAAPNSIVSGQQNIVAIKLIQKLGNAYTKNNQEKLIQLQTLFENNYLNKDIKYELISETYNPIQKLKNGESTIKHLKFFSTAHRHD